MRQSVLVTGGGGFLGTYLCHHLDAAGYQISVLDPKARASGLPEKATLINGSVLDEHALKVAMHGKDLVFHMAANAQLWAHNPSAYDRINHLGTKHVIKSAQECGIKRLVLTSTALILRGWRDRSCIPIREADPKPTEREMAGPYSRSKWHADEAARAAVTDGMDIVTLYPTVPMGAPGQSTTPPTEMIKQFLFNPPPAYLETTLNIVDADDAAHAHLLAAEKATAGDRFILSGESIGFSEILQIIAPYAKKRLPDWRIPFRLALLSAYMGTSISKMTGRPPAASVEAVRVAHMAHIYDNGHARKILGWLPKNARGTIEKTAEAIIQAHNGR